MRSDNPHWEKARKLTDKHAKELTLFVQAIVQDRQVAKSIVSDVFKKIYADEATCQRIEEPAWGYLVTMALHAWYKSKRDADSNERKLTGYSILHANERQESHQHAMEHSELMQALEVRIHHLPERTREAFKLLRAGYSTREVADKMGISEQTVRNMKTNSINILHEELFKMGLLHMLWLLW